MKTGMPSVRVIPDTAVIKGGMNLAVAPMFAKPGTAQLAYNYEFEPNGGVARVYGIEPFDGHPAPSSAAYVYIKATATISGIAVGNTLVGGTSAATGKVIYVSGAFVAVTRVTGAFASTEALKVGGVTKATASSLTEPVDGFLDNTLNKLAADDYQADIGKVPGAGRIRGVAVLNDVVYAWRNNVGQTALAIYKHTASGWTLVTMYEQISFTAGGTAYTEGSTLMQGGVTATVKRVVLESGAWGGTAAGRLIIGSRSGGNFGAGAGGGSVGSCTLSGAQTAITLLPNGTVSHDAYNFTAALSTKRLYGCDGINAEFEFDGDVWVPLNTGMGSVRATVARCHKNYLFLAYRGSLQHCSLGTPYIWSAILGAGELGTGDIITNLVSIGGATDASALMVLGQNSLHVLYGDSTLNWNIVPLSQVQGAQFGTAQDIGGVVALDTPGVVRYPATQSFGNFLWDVVSNEIQPLAREQVATCSVYATGRFKYRIFLSDGTVLSGLPKGAKGFEWSVLNYGVVITCAEHAEIAGVARTFYGDENGWVYEADNGRSFAGASIQYALKLYPLNQRSPMTEKAYRHGLLEVVPSSACQLSTAAEFLDDQGPSMTNVTSLSQYGAGLIYDLASFDQTYWDTAGSSTKTIPIDGVGTGVALMVAGESASELSHTLHSVTVAYTPRKIVR